MEMYIVKYNNTGAPNDGFPLNALKTLARLSRVLSDLQKCILSCAKKFLSVRSSLGILSLFEIKRTSVLFPGNFSCYLKFTKVRIFLIPLYIAFSVPKILGSFLYGNSLTWGVKQEILNFRKSYREFVRYKLRKLYMKGTFIWKFLVFLKLQKILSNFWSSEQIYFTESSCRVPLLSDHQEQDPSH